MFPLSYPLSSGLLSVFQSSYSSVPDRYWFGDNLDVKCRGNRGLCVRHAPVPVDDRLHHMVPVWPQALQATFTQAFSECCDIDIQPMTVSSKTHSRLFHMILFIATYGIYGIVLVGLSCAAMNRHK